MDVSKKMFKKRNFLWRLFTFSGYMEVGSFWSEIGIRLIGFLCAAIFLCILLSVALPGDTEEIIALVEIVLPIFAVIWAIPMVALTRRRLRDAGLSAKTYLWLLLPVVGWIIFIVRLCARSVPREPNKIWFE